MAVIRRSLPWVVQPPGFSEIDWQHPFSNRLRFALNPATGMTNLAGGNYPLNVRDLAFGAGQSGIVSVSGEAEYSTTLGLTNGLTLFAIMRARAVGYQFADGNRTILSSRTAENRGWTWSRVSAAGGGAFGNVTGQGLTLNGVAAYSEINKAIDSERNVPVAVRYDRVEGKISWFADGVKSSPDTAAAKTGTDGAGLVYRQEGTFSSPGTSIYLDQLNNTLAFAGLLSDDEIADLSANPWQMYKGQRTSTIISLGGGSVPATVDGVITSLGAVAYAGTGAVTAAVGPASASLALSGQGAVAYAGAGAISITLAAPVSASVAGMGGIAYAGAGAVSIAVADPAKPTVLADLSAAGGIVYAGMGASSADVYWPSAAASVAGVGAVSYAGMGAVSASVIPALLPVSVDMHGIGGIAYAGTGAISVREGMDAATESLYLSIADYNTHLSKASGARYLSIARI